MTTRLRDSGPAAYPMVGHVPQFLRDRLGFLSRCAARYGDVVELKIGERTFLLNNAEDVRHVLMTNARNYTKTSRLTSARGKRLSGEGLLTMSGETHLNQRRMMQPAFHQKAIAGFADMIVDAAGEAVAGWREGAAFDVAAAMSALSQRVVLKALFSTDVEDLGALGAAISLRRRYMDYMFFTLLPFPEYLPTRRNREYRKAMERIDAFIYGAIAKRRRAADRPHDLLSMLMSASYRDGASMNDRQVHDEALTMTITGYETVGEALSWTWYLLAQHPAVKSRFHAELARVLNGRLPTLGDLPALTYAQQVLDESMRIYPPTWIFIRMARNGDVLPSGTRVPAGSKLYMCPYVMHRNPAYFPEPEKFDPERFSEEARKERHRVAHFPFGTGPRVCIGEQFARMEATLILAVIAQRFDLALMPDHKVVPEPRMTLRAKHGIMMKPVARPGMCPG
jgi:cytochrome P450